MKLKHQYFGHLMLRADSLKKTLMLGKTDGRRSGVTEDEMVGQHHQLNGHEFEQTQGDNEGQGSPAYCSPWDLKDSDVTQQLNNRVGVWLSQYESGQNLNPHPGCRLGTFTGTDAQFKPAVSPHAI